MFSLEILLKMNPAKYFFHFENNKLQNENQPTLNSMKSIITYILGILCIALSVLSFSLYHNMVEQQRITESLESQLTEMQEKVTDGLIVRRISKQMEDIAYQQKGVSDTQREEAMAQTRIANEMRIQAEQQRQNAVYAEKHAIQTFELAEEQRAIAEERQIQAEYAKSVADTLGFIALSRSLSSLSQIQYQAQNYELAALMAYAAYNFAVRYDGNLFFPEIYTALVMNSRAVSVWNEHKGGISRIVASRGQSDEFFTVSKYGEIVAWNYGEEITDSLLFRDSSFDFRDIYADDEQTLYALSFDGRMMVLPRQENQYMITFSGKEKAFQFLISVGNDRLASIAGNQLFFYSKEKRSIQNTITLPVTVSAVEKIYDDYFLFGNNGTLVRLKPDGSMKEEKLLLDNTSIRITACAWSEQQKVLALGSSSGIIYMMDQEGKVMRTLLGHQSAITQLNFQGDNLISSSYDMHLKMWNKNLEPIDLVKTSDWIYSFYMTDKNSIWIGDESGTLSRVIISPVQMASRIKEKLSREFTLEEWNTYIGMNIPYEMYKFKKNNEK